MSPTSGFEAHSSLRQGTHYRPELTQPQFKISDYVFFALNHSSHVKITKNAKQLVVKVMTACHLASSAAVELSPRKLRPLMFVVLNFIGCGPYKFISLTLVVDVKSSYGAFFFCISFGASPWWSIRELHCTLFAPHIVPSILPEQFIFVLLVLKTFSQ